MPPAHGGDPGAEAAPKEVVTAFQLWIASIVVSVIGIVYSFATLGDTVRDQVQGQVDADPSLDAGDLESLIRLGLVIGAVFALLFVALELFFIFKMRAGRNWARIVLTVLGVLSVLATVFSLSNASAVSAAFGLVQAALIVAAIVFMFTGGARAHFAPRPQFR